MLKVVIDTNVAVSALLSPHGNSAQIIDRIFKEDLEVYYCSSILSEYRMILARPRFGFSVEDQEHIIEGMKRYGVLISPSFCDIPFTDESDRVFYETAQSAGAYLVTGNARHFPNEAFIISPARCMDLLSTSDSSNNRDPGA